MRAISLSVVIFVVLLAASPRCAEIDLADVRARLGETVYVTDVGGVEVSGPLAGLSSGRLAIDGYSWQMDEVLRIERRGDRVWDGALIGAGWSAILNAPAISCGRCFARWVGFWSAVGFLIDVEHVGRTTVYQRPRSLPRRSVITPSLTEQGKGIRLIWSFRRLR